MNIDFVNGHCFYCNYSKDKAENNLPSSPAECFMCELSNTSIASLVPYRKSFIHRECRKYIHLFETKHLQVNFINRESVVINCEICLEERGKMIKCIINNCYRYSHILCGKIYDQIVDSNHIPYYVCTFHHELNKQIHKLDSELDYDFINQLFLSSKEELVQLLNNSENQLIERDKQILISLLGFKG